MYLTDIACYFFLVIEPGEILDPGVKENNNKKIRENPWKPDLFDITPLKGLSHEIDFKNVDENGQILA